MKLFKNSNDPDYPGEKQATTKDIFVCLWIFFITVSGLAAVYSLIWAAWHTFQLSMTLLVTAGIFLVLTIAFYPDEDDK